MLWDCRRRSWAIETDNLNCASQKPMTHRPMGFQANNKAHSVEVSLSHRGSTNLKLRTGLTGCQLIESESTLDTRRLRPAPDTEAKPQVKFVLPGPAWDVVKPELISFRGHCPYRFRNNNRVQALCLFIFNLSLTQNSCFLPMVIKLTYLSCPAASGPRPGRPGPGGQASADRDSESLPGPSRPRWRSRSA